MARSVEPAGSGGVAHRGRTTGATYLCPGKDGQDGGHEFRAKVKFGQELDQIPDRKLRCPECGRTNGFEVRVDVIEP